MRLLSFLSQMVFYKPSKKKLELNTSQHKQEAQKHLTQIKKKKKKAERNSILRDFG